MKAFIVLFAVVAAAHAEADPYLLAHPYAYGAYPYAYGAAIALKPCTNAAGEAVECAIGTHASAHLVHALGKRSAEAEADPAYLLAHPYAHAYGAYAAPLAYAAPALAALPEDAKLVKPCTNAWGLAVPCAAGAYAHEIKREKREADPAYFAVHHPYAAWGYGAFPYAAGLVHTSHFGVCLNNEGEQVAC
jgi:hypothetical protein